MGDRSEMDVQLQGIETETGRGTRKWTETRPSLRRCYAEALLQAEWLKGGLFVRVHEGGKSYLDRTASAITDSLAHFALDRGLGAFQNLIFVDGANDQETRRMGKLIRDRDLIVQKLKGVRDQGDPMIRLADSLAGMARHAHEGDKVYQELVRRLEKVGLLTRFKIKNTTFDSGVFGYP